MEQARPAGNLPSSMQIQKRPQSFLKEIDDLDQQSDFLGDTADCESLSETPDDFSGVAATS
jgi:hypothetical protein